MPAARTTSGSSSFQQFHRGVPVEGANVFFRINNGNIVQFGADRVADVRTNPTPKIDRVAALASILRAVNFRVAEIEEIPTPARSSSSRR